MKTVGDLLKNARQEKKVSLDQIANYTKIHKKYLEAIESNDFQSLPPAAFTKGFLNTYATIVGLNPHTILAIFRRDYDQDDRGRIIPRSLVDPVKPAPLGITPGLLTIGISVLVGVLIIGFFVRQIIQFSSAPPLNLAEPAENAMLISPVTVRGITDPESSVTVNDRVITVGPNGAFMNELQLTPGQHTLIIISTGRSGKKTTFERVIYVEPAPINQ